MANQDLEEDQNNINPPESNPDSATKEKRVTIAEEGNVVKDNNKVLKHQKTTFIKGDKGGDLVVPKRQQKLSNSKSMQLANPEQAKPKSKLGNQRKQITVKIDLKKK